MEDFFYKKVIAYQKARTFVIAIYALVKKFPEYEKYALCDQSRRAVISIPSNIAEGLGRMAVKERIHFLEIAYSSLNEVTCQMDIAQALNYITSEELDNIESMSAELGNILSGLRQSLINKIR
jgi:four helix bundle protein